LQLLNLVLHTSRFGTIKKYCLKQLISGFDFWLDLNYYLNCKGQMNPMIGIKSGQVGLELQPSRVVQAGQIFWSNNNSKNHMHILASIEGQYTCRDETQKPSKVTPLQSIKTFNIWKQQSLCLVVECWCHWTKSSI
jgi:hypothetical protein